MPRVIVVDDDVHHGRAVERLLRNEAWAVRVFTSASEAVSAFEHQDGAFDVLLTDVVMPELGGMDLVRIVRERWPAVTPILMTGRTDVGLAVEALRGGAYDYLVKPFDPDELVRAARRGIERARLLQRNLYVERQLDVAERVGGIVGSSRPMREVLTLVGTVAPTDATVLILGESGTGKELVARALHAQSLRGAGPFVAINCGALGETVLESELFGHARGAFTGAVVAHRGLFVEASGGTLFLDEVGDLSPAMQVRLLRVLQEGEVRPVGASRTVPVDVRVIAATNRDLREEVRAGRFRQDLYFRIEVITIELPPLRARLDDLPALAHALVRKWASKLGRNVTGVDEEALTLLASHSWPGNVRELENVIERAILMTRGDTLTVASLPPHFRTSPSRTRLTAVSARLPAFVEAREDFERRYVSEVLARARGNLSEAARAAGLDRSNFRRLLRRLGLSAGEAAAGES